MTHWGNEKIVVIVSAMGKTTNALEKVVDAFFAGKKEEALQLFEQVKHQHLTTAKYTLSGMRKSTKRFFYRSRMAAA